MDQSHFNKKLNPKEMLVNTITRAVECQLCDNSYFFYGNQHSHFMAEKLYEEGWRYAIHKQRTVEGAICFQCYNVHRNEPELVIIEEKDKS